MKNGLYLCNFGLIEAATISHNLLYTGFWEIRDQPIQKRICQEGAIYVWHALLFRERYVKCDSFDIWHASTSLISDPSRSKCLRLAFSVNKPNRLKFCLKNLIVKLSNPSTFLNISKTFSSNPLQLSSQIYSKFIHRLHIPFKSSPSKLLYSCISTRYRWLPIELGWCIC